MKRKRRTRTIKKALKNPENFTQEEYQKLVSALYNSLLADSLNQVYKKRKGFGYVERPTSINYSELGISDGVRSEGEQPAESGQS